MRRYSIVKASDEISDLNFMTDSEHGNWIKYDDYIAEKESNVVNPLLREVTAIIKSLYKDNKRPETMENGMYNFYREKGYNEALKDLEEKISEHFR